MLFTSPIWLLGLLPWLAFALFLLSGRLERTAVPFLALWAGPIAVAKPRRAFRKPPAFILLIIVATLLAILAAAGPRLTGQVSPTPITILLDRGFTMSARTGNEPFRGVIALTEHELVDRFGFASVDLVAVPGQLTRTSVRSWAAAAREVPPTALPTRLLLEQAIAQRLRDTSGPVIVLTDQKLGRRDDRLVQIAPERPVEDAGIALLAARTEPTPQLLVRLSNQSALNDATVRVTIGESRTIERKVLLPPIGQTRDVFIDVPDGFADRIRVDLQPEDDAPVNNHAWLVREASWPLIEPMTTLSPAVNRVIQIYTRQRPADSNSSRVVVTTREPQKSDRAVWISPAAVTGADTAAPTFTPTVTPHPITRDVAHWPAAADSAAVLPNGFTSLVSISSEPLIAVRDDPARQVWINVDLAGWSKEPAFVIFFSNVFGWIGGGGATQLIAHGIGQIGNDWRRVDHSEDSTVPFGVEPGLWPGIYHRKDGAMQAINAGDLLWEPPPVTDWRARLARLAVIFGDAISLRPWFCVAATACIAVAAAVWPFQREKNVTLGDRAQDRQPQRV